MTPKQCLEIRQKLGWSQSELGHRADVSLNTVSGFETGKPGIKKKTVAKIREGFAASGWVKFGPRGGVTLSVEEQ